MARFYGEVGYGTSVETPPDSGVWVSKIVEIAYMGNVIQTTLRMQSVDSIISVNDDLSVSNSISIVADPYALENFSNIKYVRWSGVLWKVKSIEVQRPRLILYLGSVYNGPTN